MGVGCELCTIVMNAAKYMAQNQQSDQKVLDFIKKQLCTRLGSLNSTCVEYIEQEGLQIIQLLINAVDPSLVCRQMGLCLKIQVTDDQNEKFYDLNVRNTLNCTLCKMVFEQVKRMLSEQKSQAKIIDYINTNLCLKVGNKSKELCRTLIDSYGPLFLEIISRDVNPSQICIMIGMCQKQEEIVNNQENNNNQLSINSSPNCVLCEFVLNLLEKKIDKNATASEIEQLLQFICDHSIPKTIKQDCSNFVSAYGKIIVSLIMNQVSPDKVCSFIGLCNKSSSSIANNFQNEQALFFQRTMQIAEKKKSAALKVQESRNSNIKCTVCQFAMQYLSNEYEISRTGKVVEFTIENVCKLTPKSYRSHCESMIDKHGVRLLEFIDKYSEPLRVCNSIKLCVVDEQQSAEIESTFVELVDIVPAQPKVNNELLDKSSGINNQSMQCSLCIYIAELVNDKLKTNKTEEQIVSELKLVCNFFPNNLKDQVKLFFKIN